MTWRRGQKVKNDLIYWAVRGVLAPLGELSLEGAAGVGASVGRLAYWLAAGERRRALDHIRLALGEEYPEPKLRRLVRGCFEHLGRSAGELIAVRSGRAGLEDVIVIDEESREHMARARASRRGVLGVSGHLGNWELMALGLAATGFPVNTVARRSYDPRFDRLIERFRESRGVHCLYRRDPGLTDRALASLSRCELLGLLIDQDTRVPSVFVDFFGRPAATPIGAAWLARRGGCPVQTYFTHRRSDGRHQVLISAPLELSQASDPEQALREDTALFTRRIEAQLRTHPEQWVWMHQRWKTRPS